MKPKDLTGRRFGRLVVVGGSPTRNKKTQWLCLCDCGTKVEVNTDHLQSGHTGSCGCLRRERLKASNTTHGMRDSRLYTIWAHMRQRCNNPQNKDYKYYGGRGISICAEWRENFKDFHDWAVTNGYADNLTLDRIDANGNYTPQNCRWVTQAEQNRNKRPRKKGVMP